MNKNIHNLARAVIIEDDYILLGYDPRPEPIHYYEPGAKFYYLPGDHIEFRESTKSASIREIKEEIEYIGMIERYLGSIENSWRSDGDNICCHIHEVNHIFKFKILDINPGISLLQIDQDFAFHWIKLDDIANIDLHLAKLKEIVPLQLSQDANYTWCSLID